MFFRVFDPKEVSVAKKDLIFGLYGKFLIDLASQLFFLDPNGRFFRDLFLDVTDSVRDRPILIHICVTGPLKPWFRATPDWGGEVLLPPHL